MRVALVGGKGMLGSDIAAEAARAGIECLVLDLPDFDICKSDSLSRDLPACDVVLNCAGYTRVDDAEKDRDTATAINAVGAGNLARACVARGLPHVYLSTDYVFDGKKGSPYSEVDPVAPLNFYGRTKLEGERAVMAAGGDWAIVRTQSLYGLKGRNFVKAILGQIQQGRKELRVVSDQVSSPTYTPHLAAALLRLSAVGGRGLFHVSSSGHCSWFEFAAAIVRAVGADAVVLPRSTAEMNFPALRPAFSVLDSARYTSVTGQRMPSWAEGLAAYLAEEPLARK